jgi:L-lactate dehydrogenase complex protein LldG
VDIDLPRLLLRVRSGEVGEITHDIKPNAPPSLRLALRAFTWLATGRRRFAAAQKLAGLGSRLLAPISPWLRLPAITGWGYSKDFPRPAGLSFHERWQQRVRAGEGQADPKNQAGGLEPGTVVGAKHPVTAAHPAMEYASPDASPDASPTTQNDRLIKTGTPGGASLDPEPAPPASTAGLQARFAGELQALGGQVIACAGHDLASRILEVLQAHGIQALQAWEPNCLPGDLLPALEQAGIRITHTPDPALRAGLTGALAGIAETGTLALPGATGQPLTASLLPEIHLAVLEAKRIYETLGELLHLREVRQASSVALISGPSRTADIEMTLTIGVHGPGEVVVFLWT